MSRMFTLVPLFSLTLACGDKGDDTSAADDTAAAESDTDTDTDTDTDADADADTDTDTDTDSDTDADIAAGLQATGTWDGTAFSASCTAEELLGASTPAGEDRSINLICTDLDAGFGIAVSGLGLEAGTYTVSDLYNNVQVTEASTAEYVNSNLHGATAYSLEVVTHEVDSDGNVDWSGSFSWTGASDQHSVEISGTFSGRSTATGR